MAYDASSRYATESTHTLVTTCISCNVVRKHYIDREGTELPSLDDWQQQVRVSPACCQGNSMWLRVGGRRITASERWELFNVDLDTVTTVSKQVYRDAPAPPVYQKDEFSRTL